MIKLLHSADFHLDSPFDALPEEQAIKRRDEGRGLLHKIAHIANEERVDAVLLAGDLLDSDKSYYETASALIGAFNEINAPIFITPGNHDYYHPRSPWAAMALPKHVHLFTTQELSPVEIAGGRAVVWGTAFTANRSHGLLDAFSATRKPGVLQIGVMHGQVTTQPEIDAAYNPITPGQIASSGLNYLALGHEHTYSGLQKSGDTYYAYSGCPEGRGFDETGEKGVILAEVSDHTVSARFVPLGGRAYHRLHVNLTDEASPITTAERALPPTATQDLFRLIFRGETDQPLDTQAIHAALEHRVYHLEIRDETRLVQNVWAGAEEDTLKGLFLRKMRTKYEAASEDERTNITWAIRYALNAMENREQWRP